MAAPQLATSRERLILDAAKELFFERGFVGTSVVAIGERAGVSGPAIYNHFESKDEILATLCFEAIDRVTASAAMITDDPRADLAALVREYAQTALAERQLASVYVTESKRLAPPYARLLDRRVEQHTLRWIGALERCWPQADRDRLTTVAHATMGVTNSTVFWTEDAFEAPDAIDVVVTMSLAAASVLDRDPVDG